MKKITLRPAQKFDLPILYEFEQGIVEAERPYDETLKEGHLNYYDLAAMIQSDSTFVVVAVIDGEIVGSAYADIREAKPYLRFPTYIYLGFMFVKPAHRGKGVNKQIIDEIKIWAKAQNISELRLDVYDENHAAVRAYEKAGFKKQLVNMRIDINEG